MNYRFVTLWPEQTYSADKTEIIDIDLSNPISQIIINYKPTTGAEAASDAHFSKCISKIELIDGSDVLLSLSGQEADALDWYSNMKTRPNITWYLATSEQDLSIFINLGRSLWDTELALDPSKFKNLQLKITLDIDGGGFNNSQVKLAVFAHVFDEKVVAPVGFLMSKEIKSYTLASASHEYTDMPIDYPYRKLLLQILAAGKGSEYCFDTIKLSEDVDKRIPINHGIGPILQAIVGQTKPYREKIICSALAAGRYFHITPSYWPNFAASVWSNSISATDIAVYEGDGGRALITQDPAVRNMSVLVEGWCPHGVIELPFGLQDDMDDWYDVSAIKNLKLDILSASAMSSSYTCQIFLQQLRKYAQ